MKYRNTKTDEIIEVEYSTTEGTRSIQNGVMWLGVGDALVKRADGTYEGYQPEHSFWADFEEVVQTRVVEVKDKADTGYYVERLTPKGWMRDPEKHLMTEIAETRAKVIAQTPIDAPTEKVVSELEDQAIKPKPSFLGRLAEFVGLT